MAAHRWAAAPATDWALLSAVDRHDAEAVDELLRRAGGGAVSGHIDAEGNTLLQRCALGPVGPDGCAAARSGHGERVASLLMDARACPRAANALGETPLLAASRALAGHGLVRLLLAARADPDGAEALGGEAPREAPLMAAALRGDALLCRLLLEARAAAELRNSQGLTAADLARATGRGGAFEALLAASQGSPAAAGEAAQAASSDSEAASGLGRGAPDAPEDLVDVRVAGIGGDTVAELRLAPFETVRTVKRLIQEAEGILPFRQRLACGTAVLKDCDVLAALGPAPALTLVVLPVDPEACLALLDAAEDGDAEAVEEAFQSAGDPNYGDEEGWTPLSVASQHGHLEVIRLLCDMGAEVDRAGQSGATPLGTAAENGHLDRYYYYYYC